MLPSFSDNTTVSSSSFRTTFSDFCLFNCLCEGRDGSPIIIVGPSTFCLTTGLLMFLLATLRGDAPATTPLTHIRIDFAHTRRFLSSRSFRRYHFLFILDFRALFPTIVHDSTINFLRIHIHWMRPRFFGNSDVFWLFYFLLWCPRLSHHW